MENRQPDDAATNEAIRRVATTQTEQHVIPATIVAFLYQHVDQMRADLFGGDVPPVVLSFDVTDRRTLGHYHLKRNGLGVRWAINLNPIHLARPVAHVLATLLHELAHAWQFEHGTPAKPPHHNREFRDRCEALGVPTDEAGHDLGIRGGTPFAAYCKRHGVAWPGVEVDAGEEPRPVPPLLPTPPAKPKGSRLRKWVCTCANPVPVRVARADFDATCNRCRTAYRPV